MQPPSPREQTTASRTDTSCARMVNGGREHASTTCSNAACLAYGVGRAGEVYTSCDTRHPICARAERESSRLTCGAAVYTLAASVVSCSAASSASLDADLTCESARPLRSSRRIKDLRDLHRWGRGVCGLERGRVWSIPVRASTHQPTHAHRQARTPRASDLDCCGPAA